MAGGSTAERAGVPGAVRAAAVVLAIAGVAYRLYELGRYGFWNDEAWVALATRVTDPSQLLVVMSSSPLAWTLALRPLALLPDPELSLRLLPLAFSLATMWMAWRLGCRLAENPLGGLLALALVALDPVSIQYAKLLKQYSAESFLALATLLVACDVDRDGRRLRTLVALAVLGVPLSNAQMLMAPPVFGALVATATVRGDRALAWRIAGAGLLVAACDATFYLGVLRPRTATGMREFWADHFVARDTLSVLVDRIVAWLRSDLLAPGLGSQGLWIALAGVAAACATRAGRLVAAVLGVLLLELVALARLELLPFGVPRVSLFFTTATLVAVGGGVAAVLPWLARRSMPVAGLSFAVVTLLVFAGRPWRAMANVDPCEDAGPFIRRIEARRKPGDYVLLYSGTRFVWSYYQVPTPVIIPTQRMSIGFITAIEDPAISVIRPATVAAALDRLGPGPHRVWYVGSRFWGDDGDRIAATLAARGTIEVDRTRPSARLMRLTVP